MAIDSNTKKFLEKVVKGTPCKFIMICKGVKILHLTAYRKGSEKTHLGKIKKLPKKGIFCGVITGSGKDIVFELERERYDEPPGRKFVLKDFLESQAGISCLPRYELVEKLTAASEENNDNNENSNVAFIKARLSLDAIRKELKSKLEELKLAIEEAYEDRIDVLIEVKPKLERLDSILKQMDTRLIDKLDEALNSGGQERSAFYQEANTIVEEYISYIKNDSFVSAIDKNPFVELYLKSDLLNALQNLKKHLS